MINDLFIPNLGLTMTEAAIVEWLRGEGERVKKGQVVLAIQTDKVTYEVEAPQDGFLHIIGKAGKKYPVASVVGWIAETKDEYEERIKEQPIPVLDTRLAEGKKPMVRSSGPDEVPAETQTAKIKISPRARRLAQKKGVDFSAIRGSGPDGRITETDVLRALETIKKTRITEATPDVEKSFLISSTARKMAEDHGIDLADLKGTGPGGRIVAADVQSAIEQLARPDTMVREAKLKQIKKVIPITGVRKIIFDRMHQSLRDTAQLSLTTEADAARLSHFRNVLNEELVKGDMRISYNAILVNILCRVLEAFPLMNSSVVDHEICLWESVNIGVAMETQDGLVVPVIHDGNKKRVLAVQEELDVLIRKTRERKLMPDDLQGGTFTLTNLGFLDIEAFTPILNPPESGILGVGKILEKPVVENGSLKVGQRMMLSLTFDHRIMDGADGARFLKEVKRHIEEPYRLSVQNL
jgi:pyruvate/2-oxoglutarate dehydrogenase complex dihydrolipoamide acyltransferase (E2) component